MAHIKLTVQAAEGDTELSVEAEDTKSGIRLVLARALAVYGVTEVQQAKPVVTDPPQPQAAEAFGDHQGKLYDKSTGLPLPERAQPPQGQTPVVTAQENAGPPPWEAQAQQDAPSAQKVAQEKSKPGRRTNEELAADNGVSLGDVKAWLGEGQRVSKSKIEEFASLHPSSINNQTLDKAGEHLDNDTSSPLPERPAEAVAQTPPESEEAFSEMPTSAFGEWDPFSSQEQSTPQASQDQASNDDLPF